MFIFGLILVFELLVLSIVLVIVSVGGDLFLLLRGLVVVGIIVFLVILLGGRSIGIVIYFVF